MAVVNYADEKYRETQLYCSSTAYKRGKADKVFEYSPQSIDSKFKEQYSHILNAKRGGGYWIWKPYIIKDALSRISNGDYLFYCDSGSYFINSIRSLIRTMERDHTEIMTFQVPLIEKQWTKKELLDYFSLSLDSKEANSCQRIATYMVLKKSKNTVAFIDEYLKVCCDSENITDKLVRDYQDIEFIDHRHDQSVFSLLCKKYDFPAYRDPSEYGIKPELLKGLLSNSKWVNPSYRKSDYPQIIVCHKSRKVTFKVKLMANARRLLPAICYRNLINFIVQNK